MTEISQAELKPFKVGETLAGKAEGNPEPSSSLSNERACVETRRKVCIKCSEAIPKGKYSNAKYCSEKCRTAYGSLKWKTQKGLIKKPGVGSGGNQLGEDNHQYKTGIGSYSKKAFEYYGKKCNRCNSTELLLVHHTNHNRKDNALQNLEVLCKSCHQRHHEHRDNQGRYTKG